MSDTDTQQRIATIAQLFVERLCSPTDTTAIRNFAMMFGNSRVGEDSAKIAAANLRLALKRGEVTSLSNIVESYTKPFNTRKKTKASTRVAESVVGSSLRETYVKQQMLPLYPGLGPFPRPATDPDVETAREEAREKGKAMALRLAEIQSSLATRPPRLFFFNDSTKYCVVRNEADVADLVLMVIERHVMAAASEIFAAQAAQPPGESRRLYIQAQEVKMASGRYRTDHTFTRDDENGVRKTGALVEFKGPGKLNYLNWLRLMYTETPSADGNSTVKKLLRHKQFDKMPQDVRAWLAQLLGYAMHRMSHHTMAMDDRTSIPVIWESASGQPPTPADTSNTADTAITMKTYSLQREKGQRKQQKMSLMRVPQGEAPSVILSLLQLVIDGLV